MGSVAKLPRVARSGGALDRDGASAMVGLYEVSKIISAAGDLTRGLRDVVNLLPTVWGIDRTTIVLRDAAGRLKVAASSWTSDEVVRRGEVRLPAELVMPVMSLGVPVVMPDVKDDPLFRLVAETVRPGGTFDVAFIGVAVKAGGIPIGVLCAERIYDPDDCVTFEADVRFLSVVANMVGQAVCAHSYKTAFVEVATGAGAGTGTGAEAVVASSASAARAAGGGPEGGSRGAGTGNASAGRQTTPDRLAELGDVIGDSPRMQEVFADLRQIAPTRTTVLLRGDSGTGKEMMARAVHALSPRRTQPFIKVNCAALSETLLESELFGHERGAFTGAQQERKGRFELAHGGTLFLDEIGEISPAFQAKLLRVLQEGEFERVGGSRTLRVDVRLVAATNRNLEDAVASGAFRADLYFRLNVVPVFLPPLRERREDIPPLVEHFLKKFNQENRKALRLSRDAMRVVAEECSFPGNIRELENCVRRLCTLKRGEVIEVADFPCRRSQCASPVLARRMMGQSAVTGMPGVSALPPPAAPLAPLAPAGIDPLDMDGDDDLDGLGDSPDVRRRLVEAMEKSGWVQAKAARMLGLTARQIGYALRKHRVDVKRL